MILQRWAEHDDGVKVLCYAAAVELHTFVFFSRATVNMNLALAEAEARGGRHVTVANPHRAKR